jgi:hypothetical protein
MENKQYSHDNRGPEFVVMEVFAMTNTNVRKNRQDRDAPDTFHPLSVVLKPRDFEHIVADERHMFRGRTPIARTEAFQYYQRVVLVPGLGETSSKECLQMLCLQPHHQKGSVLCSPLLG